MRAWRPGVAGHAHHEAAARGHVAGFDQGVEGDIYPAPLAFRQVDHARQFGRAEVVGSSAGGKMLEPHVYGVGSGGQGGEKGGRIPGRSQEFGQGQGRGGGGNLGHESSLAWARPQALRACGPDVRAGRAALGVGLFGHRHHELDAVDLVDFTGAGIIVHGRDVGVGVAALELLEHALPVM